MVTIILLLNKICDDNLKMLTKKELANYQMPYFNQKKNFLEFNLNNFGSDLIINSANSISVDDMYLIKINDEYPSNIVTYENE